MDSMELIKQKPNRARIYRKIRELRVLGHSYRDIQRELKVSPRTISRASKGIKREDLVKEFVESEDKDKEDQILLNRSEFDGIHDTYGSVIKGLARLNPLNFSFEELVLIKIMQAGLENSGLTRAVRNLVLLGVESLIQSQKRVPEFVPAKNQTAVGLKSPSTFKSEQNSGKNQSIEGLKTMSPAEYLKMRQMLRDQFLRESRSLHSPEYREKMRTLEREFIEGWKSTMCSTVSAKNMC